MKNLPIKERLRNFFNVPNIVLLHFAIFSIGLFKFNWTVSREVYKHIDIGVITNHICDWIAYFKHGKLPQLLFFGFSLCSLLIWYGLSIFVIAFTSKQNHLRIKSLHLWVWAAYFSWVVLINLGYIVLQHLFFVWAASLIAMPLFLCLQHGKTYIVSVDRKFGLSFSKCWVATGIVALIYALTFSPFVIKPLHIANDFMDIPEQTRLHNGQTVDNTQFTNEHHIGGLYLYDPRKDQGRSLIKDMASVNVPKTPLLSMFLSNPKHRLFAYDDEQHLLTIKGRMSLRDYLNLFTIYQYDPENREKINDLQLQSKQIADFYKTRIYGPTEREFIKNNTLENNAKIKSGWFFFHHSWVLNPILALSLGAEAKSQVFIYGWGSAVFLKNLLLFLGGINFQNYFTVMFAFYPIYFVVFLIVLYGIFRRADFVFIGAVLLSLSTYMCGYNPTLLAPGYNPIRHLFDMVILLMFFLYLQKNKFTYLLASLLLGFVSILWSKDFGLFLMLGLIATGILKLIVMDRVSWGKMTFWLTGLVIGFGLYMLPYHGVNYNMMYMLLGYTIPGTSSSMIFIILSILSVFYFFYIQYKSTESPYYWLSLCLFFYVQLQLIYYIWNPSYHHLLVLTPSIVMLGLTWVSFLADKRRSKKKNDTSKIGLFFCLVCLGVYPATLARFYMSKTNYERVFSTHVVHNWSFQGGQFQTTMQPQLFAETIDIIQHYEAHSGMYLLSKYDSILPVLAQRYQAFPVVNLALDLISYEDIDRCVRAININKPQYIFVDTDIRRDRRSELLSKDDSLAANGNYNESYGRAFAHNNMQQLFQRIQNNYQLVKKGGLLSVYQRKPHA